jgi:alpha-L-fucosidase
VQGTACTKLEFRLSSFKGEPNESWPFPKMPFAKRQRYQQLYKTWNPCGFDADGWMNLVVAGGVKTFFFS